MTRARPHLPLLLLLAAVAVAAASPATGQYVPPPGDAWEARAPADVGMDAAAVREAVAFAISRETDAPRDLKLNHYLSPFAREPFGDATGPFAERGDPSGVIVRGGYIVAEWGDPRRADNTFSVTKSFLTATVGLAHDRGMIPDLHAPVAVAMAPVQMVGPQRGIAASGAGRLGDADLLHPFDTEHNRRITWDHLLRQTSDWEGTLWGKPDWSDRPARDLAAELERPRHEPGSVWEYNDVRVNVLALAALNVWRRPLPEVLREHLMDPIGASASWRWFGYDDSWVNLDGRLVQSVSGGAHWGGGMTISARDMARFGLLTLRDGRWGDRQVLSREFLAMARTPTPVRSDYGFMNWFLNTGQEFVPSAPESAFLHMGAGTNMVYVDPENDLVIVARWIERGAMDELIGRVIGAIR
jgi:CubicO group peptidase (beta-lactamase class C family)